MKHTTKTIAVILLAGSLGACSGLTTQQRDIGIGAAAGGVLGSVVSGGSTLGTLGGAAVGGLIGNEVNKRH